MNQDLDFYDRYLLALGRLCASWAHLDNELAALVGALLDISPTQSVCIVTEMKDIAPRCRLVRTLSYTVEAPREWREDVGDLCNIIANELAPARNRYIHDRFGVDDDKIYKADRRAKLMKPEAFADLELHCLKDEVVDKDDVENLALRAMSGAARLATARFDLEFLKREGRFPEQPRLERWRVKQIPQLRFPPDDEESSPPLESSPE